MSYNLAVAADRPLALYPFSSDSLSVPGVSITSNIFNPNLTQSSVTPGYFLSRTPGIYSKPLVSELSKSLLLNYYLGWSASVSASTYVPRLWSASNQYDFLKSGKDYSTFTIEFWISFEDSLNGSGYNSIFSSGSSLSLGEVNSSSELYAVGSMNVYGTSRMPIRIISFTDVYTPSTTYTENAVIYYDYNKNTFNFRVGQNCEEASFTVRNTNTPYYVIATYANGELSIIVNGESGRAGRTSNSWTFSTGSSPQIHINNYKNTLSSLPISYSISNLAFYDRKLSLNSIRRKNVWAYHNDKPTLSSQSLGTSMFDASEKDYHLLHYENISGLMFQDNYVMNNLQADYNFGLIGKATPSFTLDPASDSSASIYFTGSNAYVSALGARVPAALRLEKFGYLLGNTNALTISFTASFNSPSADYAFSVLNEDNNQYLYSRISSSGMDIGYWDAINQIDSIQLSVIGTISASKQAQFAMAIYNGVLSAKVIDSTSASHSASAAIGKVKFKPSTYLSVGGFLERDMFNMNCSYSNFAFSSINTDLSSYSFNKNSMFIARLYNSPDISQIGYWIKKIPIAIYGNKILSSKVIWDGMENCLVEVSTDNMLTWTTVTKNSALPGISYSNFNSDIYIRATIPFEYSYINGDQSFHNLEFSIYGSTLVMTQDLKYSMQGVSASPIYPTYNIQRKNNHISFKKDNFGIKFDQVKGYLNSSSAYAEIIPTSSVTYPYAIDFWLRIDAQQSSSNNYILNSGSSSINPKIWFSPNSATSSFTSASSPGALRYSGGAQLYIDGVAVSDNTKLLEIGIPYHVFYDFGAVYTGSALNLNGNFTAGKPSIATYGYINLWNEPVSSSTASVRYNTFFYPTTVQTSVESGSNITTAGGISYGAGYKIG